MCRRAVSSNNNNKLVMWHSGQHHLEGFMCIQSSTPRLVCSHILKDSPWDSEASKINCLPLNQLFSKSSKTCQGQEGEKMQVSFKICAAGAAYVMATLPMLSQHPWNHAKCYPHLFGLAGFSNLNSTTCPWPCCLSPIVLQVLKFTNLLPKPWHLFFLLKEHSTPWHGCPSFFRSQLRCHHPHKRGYMYTYG